MISLVKGNKDSLEGRAVIFSRYRSEDETKIFAAYAVTNPLDFFERVGAPEEIANGIAKELEKKIEELKKKEGLESILPLYAAPIPFAEERDYL